MERDTVRQERLKMALSDLLILLVIIFLAIDVITRWRDSRRASAYYRTVTAQEFRLADANGKPRGWFTTDKDCGVFLALYDKNGQTSRIRLNVDDDGRGSMEMCDARGKARAILAVGEDSQPGYGVNKNGVPGLWFFGKGRTDRLVLEVPDGSKPALWFYSRTGQQRGVLEVSTTRGPNLTLWSKRANSLWSTSHRNRT
jgi:hypothetical protein